MSAFVRQTVQFCKQFVTEKQKQLAFRFSAPVFTDHYLQEHYYISPSVPTFEYTHCTVSISFQGHILRYVNTSFLISKTHAVLHSSTQATHTKQPSTKNPVQILKINFQHRVVVWLIVTGRKLAQNIIVCHKVKKSKAIPVTGHSIVSQHFVEPEGSIPNSQELSTCSFPSPDQSSPHHPIPPLQDPS
jgi:hypothetical protein